MNEEAVRQYTNHAQATIESSPQMDEANTKAAVLREFLDLLGWEIPSNTQLEYSVKAFGKTYKVDYALILDGTPVAFLEAKGVDTAITEKHREQLEAYLKNEDVNLGILTNGKDYEFYRREVIDTKVRVNTLGKTDLESIPDRVTTLSAFRKDAIQSNEWEKILNRIKELQEARTTLEQEKDSLATEMADLFSERVSEKISPKTESQAKEMIDRLIADIESEIDSDGESVERPIAQDGSQPDLGEETDNEESYMIRILDGKNEVSDFHATNQVDAFTETVEYLIRSHDLISHLEPLPYVPGRTRPIIHTATVVDGKEMKQPRSVGDGYYLETNLSSTQKQRELRRLVQQYEFSVLFEDGW
ncbi:restriction endonuclease subunit R [Halorubrum sp. JWXQ-INN 858]|uniref:type I restriction enzyme HsdR N-terminal domain-containing protein n=1 Tax=Halorubrum sp. JWXQ-INN 858 TaxID=2690782 RepID=UPI00135714CE|nr:type I restriction enzyme HsdR N-terminal domain-containing protein [Halorubrum sp. JWXQ-INN 858]MWV65934.1 restriction endonuclease subunit R [Halorubrum sp. JWXQ-INN 858]